MSRRKKKRGRVPGTKARPLPAHKRVCVLVGDVDDPVVAIQYHGKKAHARDSGYMLFTTTAPPDPGEATDDDYKVFCLHCLGKRHPEAERGLVLAHAYGHAYWDEDEGEWIAEDGDGNEILFASGDEPTLEEAGGKENE